MPLVPILKVVFGLLSLLLLALAGWLLWSWWDGELIRASDGQGLVFVREEWRLWTGLALLAWSVFGRIPVLLLLARRDTDPTRPQRGAGVHIRGVDANLWVERRGGGEGLPIVMTHGWGLDSTIWTKAARDLGERHPVVLWDLPGLGLSKAERRGVALLAFAENLMAIVDQAGEEKVILVGHSIGGMTIQTLVRDHPAFVRQRVAGVVLLNTTFTNPLRTMIFSSLFTALRKPVLEPAFRLVVWLQPLVWLAAWQGYLSGSSHIANRFGFGRYVTRSQLEHVTLLATRNSPAVQARGNLAMFDWDATGALAALEVPLLIIGGAMDIITKPDASEVLAADGAGALRIVDGANHMGFLERSDLYIEAILRFAGGLDDVSPRTSADDVSGLTRPRA